MIDSESVSKRRRIFGKTAALAILIFALYLFLGAWYPQIKGFFKEGINYFSIFLFVFAILVSGFSVWCVLIAINVYRKVTVDTLRSAMLVLAILAFILCHIIVGYFLGIESYERLFDYWVLPIVSLIITGIFYWLTNKYFTGWLGFNVPVDWNRRRKAAKGFFGMMSLFIWNLLMELGIRLDGSLGFFGPIRSFGMLLIPLGLTVLFYKLSLKIVMFGAPEEE